MKKTLSVIFIVFSLLSTHATGQENYGPVPTQRQLAWFDMERYAFVHFSINTFTNQEWGNGDESPELFNPTHLDCRLWAKVCKEAGLKGIILTAKHHAGFCLWPSKYTEYSVKNSPWKNGKGDVVRELQQACNEYGLKLGIYLSPWDRNRADYGQSSYITYFRNQLTELLTEYGDIFEVWFDGANGGWGYYGGAKENRNIDRSTYYDWQGTINLVRKLQPCCVIWNEVGPDIRWCGNEQGSVGATNWARYSYAAHVPGQPDNSTLHTGEEYGLDFVPAEVNVSIRPGWFYHEFEDLKVKTLPKLLNIYYNSVGNGSTWLLNFPIDRDGQIHENDAKAAIELNKFLKRAYSHDLTVKAKEEKGDSSITINFAHDVKFNQIVMEEDLRTGQRIKAFQAEAFIGGRWQQIAQGTTIGHKKIVRLDDTKSQSVRIIFHTDATELPLPKVSLFQVPVITTPKDNEKYDLDRSQWKVIAPVSGNMSLMLDGDKSTMAWLDKGFPMDVVIDMNGQHTLKGFRYLPDQGDYFLRGIITNYEFAVSLDGEHWTEMSKGEFSNIAHNPLWQEVRFAHSVKARYFRFRAIRNTKGWGDFGCAELDVRTK